MAAALSPCVVLCLKNTFLTVQVPRDPRRCSSCPAVCRDSEPAAEKCDASDASTVDWESASEAESHSTRGHAECPSVVVPEAQGVSEEAGVQGLRARLEQSELQARCTDGDTYRQVNFLNFPQHSIPCDSCSDGEVEVLEESDGELELPSRGSALHSVGGCRPCAWFWRPGSCDRGASCDYCHRCPDGVLKAVSDRRRKLIRRHKREAARHSSGLARRF